MTAEVIYLPRREPEVENPHRLKWNLGTGEIVGCGCGFPADPSDCGFGNSVTDHLIDVGKTLA